MLFETIPRTPSRQLSFGRTQLLGNEEYAALRATRARGGAKVQPSLWWWSISTRGKKGFWRRIRAMAAVAASSLLAIANPNPRNLRAIIYPSTSIPFLHNPLSLSSSPSSHRLKSRRSFRVRAATLQEKDQKVTVEDSFRSETFPANEGTIADDDPSATTPGMAERWVIKFEQSLNILLTDSVIKILDAMYHDRNYARFFVLETIARVPYFAFISVLHLYESFGWWRRADYLKVHFAESWNELHHLLIMEELGGNAFWFDRFLAQHIAIFYYFMTVIMYALSPRMAFWTYFGKRIKGLPSLVSLPRPRSGGSLVHWAVLFVIKGPPSPVSLMISCSLDTIGSLLEEAKEGPDSQLEAPARCPR